MSETPQFWPTGTGQFDRLAKLVLADDIRAAVRAEEKFPGAMLLGTPLELIAELERCLHVSAASVMLIGSYARDEYALALQDIYPGLEIVLREELDL
jgi:hypothetical protein